MRTISFQALWLFWLGGVFYSLAATALGIFPDIALVSRLSQRFDEAWFICGAYVICRIIESSRAPQSQADVGAGKQP